MKNRLKHAVNAFFAKEEQNQDILLEMLGIRGTKKDIISEITYYTCMKMLGETLGKLPIKYYQDTPKGRTRADPDDIYRLVALRPNKYMTPSVFWNTVECNRNHYGNAYVWIHDTIEKKGRYGGERKILDLWPMQSQYVQILMDDAGIFGGRGSLYYQYSDPRSSETYMFSSENVMHFKTSVSFNGICGEPVRNILKATVEGALESQSYLNNLYENGLTASMVMQYTGELDDKRRNELVKKYANFLTGSKNAGKVVPVPIGLQLTPLNIKLTDAQFIELKKYSALQIAGAFGIKPNQINDYEKSSYTNSESQQLSFLVDTMLYILKHYEEEINYKLLGEEKMMEGYYLKYNEKAILRTDSKTQIENLARGVNNGIYKANEARDYLDLPQEEGGDVLMVNGNYIPITMIGKQYEKGGEKGAKN